MSNGPSTEEVKETTFPGGKGISNTAKSSGKSDDLMGLPVEPTGLEGAAF